MKKSAGDKPKEKVKMDKPGARNKKTTLKLPPGVVVYPPSEETGNKYIAEVSLLVGCRAWGNTRQEALGNLLRIALNYIRSTKAEIIGRVPGILARIEDQSNTPEYQKPMNYSSTKAEIISRVPVARIEDQPNIPKFQKPVKYQKPIRVFNITNSSGLIDFSKDGKLVAIVEAQSNPRLLIMDTDNGNIQSLSSLEQGLTNLGYMGDGSVWSMAISNDGERAAVGYDDGDILCWDVKNKSVLSRNTGDIWREPVSCLEFFPNDQCYAAYGGYNHISVHDVGSAKYLYPIPCHLSGLCTMAFTSDGCKLLMGGPANPCGLILEDVDSTRNILTIINGRQEGLIFKGSSGKTMAAVAIFPGEDRMLSLDLDNRITIWDAVCGDEILCWYQAGRRLKYGIGFAEGSIAISPNGKRILSAGSDNYTHLWNLDGTEICSFYHDSPVRKVSFLSDGQRALSACVDSLSLWALP